MTSHLARLTGMAQGIVPLPPIYVTLGITVGAVSRDRVELFLIPAAHLLNPHGTLAGGALASVLDTALAWVCDVVLDDGFVAVTVDLRVTLLRPVVISDRPLVARASRISTGRTTIVAQADLHDGAGRLVAVGSSTNRVVAAPSDALAKTHHGLP